MGDHHKILDRRTTIQQLKLSILFAVLKRQCKKQWSCTYILLKHSIFLFYIFCCKHILIMSLWWIIHMITMHVSLITVDSQILCKWYIYMRNDLILSFRDPALQFRIKQGKADCALYEKNEWANAEWRCLTQLFLKNFSQIIFLMFSPNTSHYRHNFHYGCAARPALKLTSYPINIVSSPTFFYINIEWSQITIEVKWLMNMVNCMNRSG